MKGNKAMLNPPVYTGVRRSNGDTFVTVTRDEGVETLPLSPSLKLRNHSPTGFEWGYMGSGPSQLSLAILLDYFGYDNAEMALDLYQDFKMLTVARFSKPEWTLTAEDIDTTIDEINRS